MDKIPHIRCTRLIDKYYKHDPDCDDPSRVFLEDAAELTRLRARIEELNRRQSSLTRIVISLIRRGSYSIVHKKNGTSMIMDSRSWLVKSVEFDNTDADLVEKLIELQSAR